MRPRFLLPFPIRRGFAALADQYRLQTGDMNLLRAQFREFVHQIPLLYLILAYNTIAFTFSVFRVEQPVLTGLFPLTLCSIAGVRGIWWIRRRYAVFTDDQICRHIHTTSRLAVMLSMAFMVWGVLLYPSATAEMRGHLVFFLAMTQIACVFLLMPVRSAGLGVATVAGVPFTLYLLLFDFRNMWIEAVTLTLVGYGMLFTLYRHNRSFAQLITSQRRLRKRQVETQRLSDENRRIAFTDQLSGLPNRRALLARLEEGRMDNDNGPNRLAVIFVDLDGFKVINDNHGHQVGDAVIKEVGRLLSSLRPDDALLARLGGDEFAMLLDCPDVAQRANHLAECILETLGKPITVPDRQFRIGASIGIAVDREGATSSYELIRKADTAMYRVKESGKGGIQHYDPSFDADRLWLQQVEYEIDIGLDRGEFAVAYQPIVDARSGECIAVEALVRWPGRPNGVLMPDDFIEIAEAGNLIQRLGMFVLRRACVDIKPLCDVKLSVNISPAQFRHPDFEVEVARVLRETGFPPHRLQLEITEKYLIDHPERAANAIDSLKDMGISFALDDFGTGFTSIAYLQSYGFDCIKLDKSLSDKLLHEPKASLLISGMVFMANGLDMKIIAEGVESEGQATLLRMAGCHGLQGFLFGKPVPLSTLLPMIERPLAVNINAELARQMLEVPIRSQGTLPN